MTARLHQELFGIALWRWLALVVAALILLSLSIFIRNALDIEWSVASFRGFAQGLGVWGPLAYIGVLTFRFLFLIPSSILLIAAGILFGPIYGALWAGLGLFGSAMLKYIFVTIAGRDVILAQLSERMRSWITAMAQQRMSAWALTGISAYPFLPKHIFQIAALLSGMGPLAYVAAVAIGSFVRGAIFATLGGAIYSGSGMIAATGILAASLLIPLAIPAWRRSMLAPFANFKTTPHSKEIHS